MARQLKMTRDTAELFVDSVDRILEHIGISIDKFAASASMQRLLPLFPRQMSKYFKYGHDRESIIKYLMTHCREPNAGERALLPQLAVQFPKLLREAIIEGGPSFFEKPRRASYRSKISEKERPQVCKRVQKEMAKTGSFARAIQGVAEVYDVNPRTIRRIWQQWKGSER